MAELVYAGAPFSVQPPLCAAFAFMPSKTSAKPAAKKDSAFNKALTPTPSLAAVIGPQPVARTEATKRLWDYIKARNLQNPVNKRNVLCDDALKAVMGKDEVTMFEMTALMGAHLKSQ